MDREIFSCERLDLVTLEFWSLSLMLEVSKKFIKISFNSDLFIELLGHDSMIKRRFPCYLMDKNFSRGFASELPLLHIPLLLNKRCRHWITVSISTFLLLCIMLRQVVTLPYPTSRQHYLYIFLILACALHGMALHGMHLG